MNFLLILTALCGVVCVALMLYLWIFLTKD